VYYGDGKKIDTIIDKIIEAVAPNIEIKVG